MSSSRRARLFNATIIIIIFIIIILNGNIICFMEHSIGCTSAEFEFRSKLGGRKNADTFISNFIINNKVAAVWSLYCVYFNLLLSFNFRIHQKER